MLYQQSREESAEILRRALQLMSPHPAGYHPLSYAVWYEHAAEINPPLSQDLERLQAAGNPLSEIEVRRLHALHIAGRDVEMFELAQRDLRTLIGCAVQDTGEAEQTLTRFTGTLAATTQRLAEPDGIAAPALIEDLRAQAEQVCARLTQLHAQLATQRNAVDGIIERLERAHSEPLRDPLTQLANLNGLRRALDCQGDGAGLAGIALLAVDIDYFKRINDTHGHVVGDKVLVKVAGLLRERLDGGDLAARLGGDEFVVLLRGKSIAAAAALAEAIRAAAQRMLIMHPDGAQFAGEVTLSVGAAVARAGDRLETLRHRADSALYEAKSAGRNRVAVAA
jgi:diguanylate cyclase